ncbi:hypothetical protein UFOVP245_92 [uncultured Caudovirales phage]|uniref:Uncharacterized protein n=1 Tax=uncultured Caudovirales phage TaxID=2100421 RepID=A0A6J7WTY1_9CAUD|nr:hypothetical protein UFOVP245_92 [uncultured Caudovirales phage]
MFNNIPSPSSENTWIFNGNHNGPIDSNGYGSIIQSTYVWSKPRGIKMVSITCLGGGGAGGLGASGTNIARGGGGGGGSGGLFTVMYPAKILADKLFVYPSNGNIPINIRNGGGANLAQYSQVTDEAGNILAYANNGGNGGDAAGTTPGTAGAPAAAATQIYFAQFGVIKNYPGVGGTAGGNGTGTAGTTGTGAWGTYPMSGGTGGGGLSSTNVTGAGGSITSTAYPIVSVTNVAGGSVGTINGWFNLNGIITGNSGVGLAESKDFLTAAFPRFCGLGGLGGSAVSASVIGNNGGNGGFGCGGGGSPGTIASTGNFAWPGLGGPGLVIISCW